MGPRPFMADLEPIGFGDLDQYGGVSGDVGFWFDDRGPLLWLRTIEGIWLVADMEAPYWWTLDVNNMPRRGHGPPACRHTGRGPGAV